MFILYLSNLFLVLIRIRVGSLMSVSRQLPDFSPFKDYGELCNYWKQQVNDVIFLLIP